MCVVCVCPTKHLLGTHGRDGTQKLHCGRIIAWYAVFGDSRGAWLVGWALDVVLCDICVGDAMHAADGHPTLRLHADRLFTGVMYAPRIINTIINRDRNGRYAPGCDLVGCQPDQGSQRDDAAHNNGNHAAVVCGLY